MTRCDRCNSETLLSIMSFFNTDIICPACKTAETREPGYQAAVDAEVAACRAGNYNFPGIGRPVREKP